MWGMFIQPTFSTRIQRRWACTSRSIFNRTTLLITIQFSLCLNCNLYCDLDTHKNIFFQISNNYSCVNYMYYRTISCFSYSAVTLSMFCDVAQLCHYFTKLSKNDGWNLTLYATMLFNVTCQRVHALTTHHSQLAVIHWFCDLMPCFLWYRSFQYDFRVGDVRWDLKDVRSG